MKQFKLPELKADKQLLLKHFPTAMQAVIFRMWDMVSKEKLAEILETTAEQVETLAADMGLAPQRVCEDWQEKGYITIIRSAWHILPYDQLLRLLGWDEAKLAYILREDDFLGAKLGQFKPFCEPVKYRPLTAAEQEQTRWFKENYETFVKPYLLAEGEDPFDLFLRIAPRSVVPSAPEAGQVILTSEWSLQDLSGAEEVPFYIDLFQADFSAYFGFSLTGTEKGGTITLSLKADLSKEEEYHEITVSEHEISITAAAPVGLLRGLMRLVDWGRMAGGPYFTKGHTSFTPAVKTRYIYSFCGLYANAFDMDCTVSYPDELLRAYARLGINGVFTQAVLYKMTEFPFAPSLSEGWEDRLERLKKTVAHLKKYGIKLYLYLNEPRCMPISFFDSHPELKGFVRSGYKKLGMEVKKAETADLCISVPAVREYMDKAVYTLCSAAPDLGGFFAITRSENPTNCYSHIDEGVEQNCPRCRNRSAQEVLAEVYNIINRAARRANPAIVTFCNTWAWAPYFSTEDSEKCMALLDPEIPVLCISEESLEFNVGGMDMVLSDYSISKVGPSRLTLANWESAKRTGHEIAAKVQFNNTWECSTIPYIPTFDLIKKHMDALKAAGVQHLMLSWTLGGYPSDNLSVISDYFFDASADGLSGYDAVLKREYGPLAEKVKNASRLFSKAFAEFPFSLDTLYMGPHNAGVSNLMYDEPTGFLATMTCYCYDDLESWRSDFPVEIYENQHRLLWDGWKRGMEALSGLENFEIYDMAKGCDCVFASCSNQIRFVRLRNQFLRDQDPKKKEEMIVLLEREIGLAQAFYTLMQKNPSIGYEAANHYYCNQSMLTEKIMSCRYLIEGYKAGTAAGADPKTTYEGNEAFRAMVAAEDNACEDATTGKRRVL